MTQQLINLQVTPQQVDIILQVLSKQPWEIANGLIQTIIEQARTQMPPPETEPQMSNQE